MDVSDPTRSVTPTLDGPVLAALATAGRPLTVGQVAEIAVRGSEIGIRRSLDRLVEQGIVRATVMGRNRVHELNREHVAADIAVMLGGLRAELWERFRKEFAAWRPAPLYAAVFGSAARGDGDEGSDIDLLLVHPPFKGEKPPARLSAGMRAELSELLGRALLVSDEPDAASKWQMRVDLLRYKVEAWTGNRLQVVDLGFFEWRQMLQAPNSVLDEVRRDGIELKTSRAMSLWGGSTRA